LGAGLVGWRVVTGISAGLGVETAGSLDRGADVIGTRATSSNFDLVCLARARLATNHR